MNSFVVIQPGYSGVIFNIWTGTMRTVGQGMAFRMPFVSKVQSYPTALRTYTMVQRAGEGTAAGDDSTDAVGLTGGGNERRRSARARAEIPDEDPFRPGLLP